MAKEVFAVVAAAAEEEEEEEEEEEAEEEEEQTDLEGEGHPTQRQSSIKISPSDHELQRMEHEAE